MSNTLKMLLVRLVSTGMLAYYKLLLGSRLELGKGVITNHKLKISGPGRVVISDEANLWAFCEPNNLQTFSSDAEIRIGKKTRLNGATIQSRQLISIGDDCLLGSTQLLDNDFHHIDPSRRRDKSEIPTRPIYIADNVWLAGQSAVLKGVTIGRGSVVGFRSVVTKDVPEGVVVAGNPAIVVKNLNQ